MQKEARCAALLLQLGGARLDGLGDLLNADCAWLRDHEQPGLGFGATRGRSPGAGLVLPAMHIMSRPAAFLHVDLDMRSSIRIPRAVPLPEWPLKKQSVSTDTVAEELLTFERSQGTRC